MSEFGAELQRRLESISEYKGVSYGRAHIMFDAEAEYSKAAARYPGFLALSDAFKCFFLESVEATNKQFAGVSTAIPISDRYAIFLPRLVHCFRTLCGSERISLKGYPFEGYNLLRNTFDSLVLVSAALQGISDFYSIEGIEQTAPFDLKKAKKLRKNTEHIVWQSMTGDNSGLSATSQFELRRLNDMFDWETHGARLSLAKAMGWMKCLDTLPVVPSFVEENFALFMNRYTEIAWMAHRLIPSLQSNGIKFDQSWVQKWGTIDEVFSIHVNSMTAQLSKPVGAAVVEFVTLKFPFGANSKFPD